MAALARRLLASVAWLVLLIAGLAGALQTTWESRRDMLGEGLSGGEIGLRAVWGAGGEGLQAGGLWGF